MLSRYHVKITKESLQTFFDPAALRAVARANVRQDSLPSMFGVEARRHVCDCAVAESLAYIDEEQATIATLAKQADGARAQQAALGRLLHTVQDFFAHTNYVALYVSRWRAERGCHAHAVSPANARLDMALLTHPKLQIAEWLTWRDPLYYIPGLGNILRRVWLPAQSHEAINLDSPSRGENFHLAMAFARQWTRTETARAVANVVAHGGHAAVARFRGLAENSPSGMPQPIPGDA